MSTTTFTPETYRRIDEARQEQVMRLATRAAHMTVERDRLTGGWIVRNPRIPGTIELVSGAGDCSCRQYRTWGRCKHAARVEQLHGTIR